MIQSSKHIESVGGFGSGSFIDYSLFIHMLIALNAITVDSINNL